MFLLCWRGFRFTSVFLHTKMMFFLYNVLHTIFIIHNMFAKFYNNSLYNSRIKGRRQKKHFLIRTCTNFWHYTRKKCSYKPMFVSLHTNTHTVLMTFISTKDTYATLYDVPHPILSYKTLSFFCGSYLLRANAELFFCVGVVVIMMMIATTTTNGTVAKGTNADIS